MSFPVFKQNMLLFMQNQEAISSYGDFAKKLTIEYDMTIRRGFQTVNNVPVLKSNTELVETMVNLACSSELQKKSGTSDIINKIGKAIVSYWTGCTLNNFPTPIVPATGAVQNISTTSALVLNPGQFPNITPVTPTLDSGLFLDMLIAGMQIHLTTLSGVYNTISIYPGAPTPPPAPGIVTWNTFTVP